MPKPVKGEESRSKFYVALVAWLLVGWIFDGLYGKGTTRNVANSDDEYDVWN